MHARLDEGEGWLWDEDRGTKKGNWYSEELGAKANGSSALYQELYDLDPTAVRQIDPRNMRRVIRALEVCYSTGKHFPQLCKKNPPGFDTLTIGLTTERGELYQRIDSRVDHMLEQGFVQEVRDLINREYSPSLSSMSSVGDREIGHFLNGEMVLTEAVQRIKFETHRFARRQYAWFRLDDQRIHWLDVGEKVKGKVSELITPYSPFSKGE